MKNNGSKKSPTGPTYKKKKFKQIMDSKWGQNKGAELVMVWARIRIKLSTKKLVGIYVRVKWDRTKKGKKDWSS